jgi:hypothetical protein
MAELIILRAASLALFLSLAHRSLLALFLSLCEFVLFHSVFLLCFFSVVFSVFFVSVFGLVFFLLCSVSEFFWFSGFYFSSPRRCVFFSVSPSPFFIA